MKYPAKQGFFYGNILDVLTLACMQSLNLAKHEILHKAPLFSSKTFSHKK